MNEDEFGRIFLSQITNGVNEKDRCKVQENMESYGGGFVKSLGIALMHADHINTKRIKDAFPEYWEQYLNM